MSPIVTSGRPATLDDVAGAGLLDVNPLDAVGRLQAGDGAGEGDRATRLDGTGRVVGLFAHDHDPLADPDRAVPDPPDRHPADVVVGRQVRHQQLERMVGLVGRRRGDVDEQIEQRPQVGAWPCQVAGRRAQLGVGVDDREFDLVLVGAEVHEQLVDLVEDLGRRGRRRGRSC